MIFAFYGFLVLFLFLVILFFIFLRYKIKEVFILSEIKDSINHLAIVTQKPSQSFQKSLDAEIDMEDNYDFFEDFEEVDENQILAAIHDMGRKDLKGSFKTVVQSKDSESINDSVSKLKGINTHVDNKE